MEILDKKSRFQFKQFNISQSKCGMKVGTDGVLLGAWAPVETAQSAIDIGTGTGLIAVMLAQRNTDISSIVGVEIDEASYYEAKENFEHCPWASCLTVVHQSIQDYTNEASQGFDLIVSNPPFFTGGTLSDSQSKNEVRHTVKLPHGELLRSVKSLLNPEGNFSVILPTLEGYRFIELAQLYGLYLAHMVEVRPDENKEVERLLLNFKGEPTTTVLEEELILMDASTQDRTAAYKALVDEYYL